MAASTSCTYRGFESELALLGTWTDSPYTGSSRCPVPSNGLVLDGGSGGASLWPGILIINEMWFELIYSWIFEI